MIYCSVFSKKNVWPVYCLALFGINIAYPASDCCDSCSNKNRDTYLVRDIEKADSHNNIPFNQEDVDDEIDNEIMGITMTEGDNIESPIHKNIEIRHRDTNLKMELEGKTMNNYDPEQDKEIENKVNEDKKVENKVNEDKIEKVNEDKKVEKIKEEEKKEKEEKMKKEIEKINGAKNLGDNEVDKTNNREEEKKVENKVKRDKKIENNVKGDKESPKINDERIRILINENNIKTKNITIIQEIKYENDSLGKICDEFVNKTVFYEINKKTYEYIKKNNGPDITSFAENMQNNNFLLAAVKNVEDKSAKYYLMYCSDARVVNDRGIFDSSKNKEVIIIKSGELTDTHFMFYNCDNLELLDISNLNLEKSTTTSNMFNNCKKLETLNLSNLDCSNVTNMCGMFSECEKLRNINFSNFKTRDVKNMSYMFFNCKELKSLDLSNFDTSKVKDMKEMFSGCKDLTSVNLKSFKTNSATTLNKMFYNCRSLVELHVTSGFSVNETTYTGEMFKGCYKLLTPTGTKCQYIRNEYKARGK